MGGRALPTVVRRCYLLALAARHAARSPSPTSNNHWSRVVRIFVRSVAALALVACASTPTARSDARWSESEQAQYLGSLQANIRTAAGSASGTHGAVTVAYNAYAARAGLDVLQRGGNAMDAALTTAVTQVALTAGSPVSYFGIMSLVTFDAKTGRISTMWAGWNTLRGETSPLTIPGAVTLDNDEALGTVPSGRTALVGGFMKGVEAAHRRFGRLPFATIFDPAIRVAERGMPVHATLAHQFELRARDLARLPATRAALLKPDGSPWMVGDTLRQTALGATLRQVAAHGADYMYKGPWARHLVAAVQAEGGKMTLEDLASYDVIWGDPIRATIRDYEIAVAGPPNNGGTSLIEAQQVGMAAGIPSLGHWSTSPEALRRAALSTQGYVLDFLTPEARASALPGIDFSPAARLTKEHGAALWAALDAGTFPLPIARRAPRHSDDVVVVDGDGNMVAITHSLNGVYWGKTAINVDGISIGDPASFQQALVARVGPGKPLPDPTETGIVLKNGQPVLAFASMGSGLHQRTFQGLMNVFAFGMTVDQAIDAPDFYLPAFSARDSGFVLPVPKGRFPAAVLDGMGLKYREVTADRARLGGEGVWVAISRDPVTRELRAGSHNRNNSAALAW